MTKFLVLWEWDTSKLPVNREEIGKIKMQLGGVTAEALKKGWVWGGFLDGNGGFSMYEGTQEDMAAQLLKLQPYIKVKVYPYFNLQEGAMILQKSMA